MADTKISALTAVGTPAGTDEFPVNQAGTTKKMTLAQVNAYAEPVSAASVASQTISGAVDTYITGSGIAIPATRLQVGTFLRWKILMSKTAAGTATPIFTFRQGTGRVVGDTSRAAVTCGAQSAVINAGCIIDLVAVYQAVGASAILRVGVGQGVAGFHTIGGSSLSAAHDSTVAGTYLGVSLNPGTSGVWTLVVVESDLLNII